jgi:ribosomal-protein-serine acetyltransferase
MKASRNGRGADQVAAVPDELHAGTLVLRRWREEHVDALVAAVETSIHALRPWMPWAAGTPGPVEREFVRRSGPRFDEGTEFAFGIFDRNDGTLLGGCGMHRRHGRHEVEVGYWIQSCHTGKGYATLAAAALTDAAFTHLPEVALAVIHCDVANRPSARVAEKLGYVHAGDVDRAIEAVGQTGRGMVWIRTRLGGWCLSRP